MPKLTKRCVDAAEPKDTDFFVWDDELPGFGLRVFNSGKRSYLVQCRAGGRTRRVTIGPHGVWTPEEARREARSLLGRIAKGDNPAEEREIDRKAITVTEALPTIPHRCGSWADSRQEASAQEAVDTFDRQGQGRPAHHPSPRFLPREGYKHDRREQILERRVRWKNEGRRKNQTVRTRDRARRPGNRLSDDWPARRHIHLCCHAWDYSHQSSSRRSTSCRQSSRPASK